MVVLVSEEAQQVMNADPPVVRGVHVDLPLAREADLNMQEGPGWHQVLVQLGCNFEKALQNPSQVRSLLHVRQAKSTEELSELVIAIFRKGGGGDRWHNLFHKNSNKKESRTSTEAFSSRRKKSTEVGTIHTRAEKHSVQRQVATNKCRRPRQPHGRAQPDRVCSRKEVTNVRLATAHGSA